MAEKPHVIVLGTRGFIGAQVVSHLQASGRYRVTPLGSQECNLTDREQTIEKLGAVSEGAQIVMCSSILLLPGEPTSIFDDNVAMVRNVCDAIRDKGVKSFVFLSSTDVYGRPPLESPLTEDSRLNLTGHYGFSKYAAEKLFDYSLKCPHAYLRLPGVYGPTDKGKSIIGKFTQTIAEGGEIQLVNGGTQLRDYIHVRNVAEIVDALLQAPWTGVLNLATGKSVSLAEVVDKISKALGKEARIKRVSTEQPQFDLAFDVSKLRSVLPQFRLISVDEGIKEVAASVSR